MKCDNCIHKKFHSAGSWYSVAEGGDDPYNYEYCYKGHWCGDPQIEETVNMEDPFNECPDFTMIGEFGYHIDF
jgi:hypothetical protein